MAINNSNSNFVNIQSLSQSQLALDSDLIILQTQNGTQTIKFEDFNVVKTDLDGNAYILGSLSGHNTTFDSVQTTTLSSSNYFSSGRQGVSVGSVSSPSFVNRSTITNGIVTSADYVFGSPEYNSLYSLVRSTSTTQNGLFKTVYERTGFVTIQNGASASNVETISLPTSIGGLIKAYHFTLMPEVLTINFNAGTYGAFQFNAAMNVLGVALDTFTFSPGDANGDLNIRVVSKNTLTEAQKIFYRLLYFA